MLLEPEDDLWASRGAERRTGGLRCVRHIALSQEMRNAIRAGHTAADVGGEIEGGRRIGTGAEPEFGMPGQHRPVALHPGLYLQDAGAPGGGRQKILLAVHDDLHWSAGLTREQHRWRL